jgi:hypothetical protein
VVGYARSKSSTWIDLPMSKTKATIYVGAMVVLDFQASLNDWDSKVGDGGLCILKWLIFWSLFDLSTKCILIKCHKCIVKSSIWQKYLEIKIFHLNKNIHWGVKFSKHTPII